jgi:hypothetical protein
MNVPTTTNQTSCFYVAALMVHYRKEDAVKVRHMNVLLECAQPQLLKADLATIHESALQRLNQESGINPTDVVDTVILNVSLLAITTPEIFHGSATQEPELAAVN